MKTLHVSTTAVWALTMLLLAPLEGAHELACNRLIFEAIILLEATILL